MSDSHDVPGVIAPPPIIYGASLTAALVAGRLARIPALPRSFRPAGGLLASASLALAVTSFRTMIGAGTKIDPYAPTTALVDSGPFAYSRNPIYLSLTGAYVGIALLRRAALPLAVLPLVLRAMTTGVIEREERYLTKRFGDRYEQYRTRVRRWL